MSICAGHQDMSPYTSHASAFLHIDNSIYKQKKNLISDLNAPHSWQIVAFHCMSHQHICAFVGTYKRLYLHIYKFSLCTGQGNAFIILPLEINRKISIFPCVQKLKKKKYFLN